VEIEEQLRRFVAEVQPPPQWLKSPTMEMYVRLTRREGRPTLDVTNVTAHPPGRGRFTRFLEALPDIWPGPVFVESVYRDRFVRYLGRHGFEIVRGYVPTCMVRRAAQ
jgi:hypothetical protein